MIRPTHIALYFWIIEHNNRLQWKPVFGLPTDYSMQAINIRGFQHYKKALDDLERWGFIRMVSKAQNQHTCKVFLGRDTCWSSHPAFAALSRYRDMDEKTKDQELHYTRISSENVPKDGISYFEVKTKIK